MIRNRGAIPADHDSIVLFQRRRARRMGFRSRIRAGVDRLFPTVKMDDMPPHWEPPMDNALLLEAYHRRRHQLTSKGEAA